MKQDYHCNAQTAELEKRLVEAFDGLWDDLVDPAEAYLDMDGSRWSQLGGDAGHAGAAGMAFSSEPQLAEIRAQCRALAVSNEFAINGHESLLTKPPNHHASESPHEQSVYSVFRRVPTTIGRLQPGISPPP